MKIITIATQKGGAGKTTLSTNLSVASAQSNFLTLLIDADPNQLTSLEWFNKREEQENPLVMEASDHSSLEKLINIAETKGFDRVFIDTQGAATNLANKAMEVANLVLIPCSSSGFDLKAQRSTATTVRAFKKDASIILMKCPPTGRSEVLEAEQILSGLGVHINQNRTVFRKDYKESAKYSSTVFEENPTGKAAEEMNKIFEWVEKRLNKNPLLEEMEKEVIINECQ